LRLMSWTLVGKPMGENPSVHISSYITRYQKRDRIATRSRKNV
jgi:hypothetical protein